jgi:hypothetical protein
MSQSLFCQSCTSFVAHQFVPALEPDLRLRIRSVCTHCGYVGARIGHKATVQTTSAAAIRQDRSPSEASHRKDPGLATAPGSSTEAGAVARRGICLSSGRQRTDAVAVPARLIARSGGSF